jgi:hypothetical protein
MLQGFRGRLSKHCEERFAHLRHMLIDAGKHRLAIHHPDDPGTPDIDGVRSFFASNIVAALRSSTATTACRTRSV